MVWWVIGERCLERSQRLRAGVWFRESAVAIGEALVAFQFLAFSNFILQNECFDFWDLFIFFNLYTMRTQDSTVFCVSLKMNILLSSLIWNNFENDFWVGRRVDYFGGRIDYAHVNFILIVEPNKPLCTLDLVAWIYLLSHCLKFKK